MRLPVLRSTLLTAAMTLLTGSAALAAPGRHLESDLQAGRAGTIDPPRSSAAGAPYIPEKTVMNRFRASAFGALLAVVLAACSSSTGTPTPSPTPTPVPNAKELETLLPNSLGFGTVKLV